MRPILRGAGAIASALVLAACTGSPGTTTAPPSAGGTTVPVATSGPGATSMKGTITIT